MPTIRELKAKIKKYKDTHCAGISRMKKANLIRMADKIGLNPPSDDVKTLRSVIKAHQTKNCAAYSKLSKPKLIQMCKKLGLLDSESKERESKKLESKRSSRDPFVSTETEDERAVRRRVLGPILEDESSEIMRRTARINRGYDEPIKLKLKKKKKSVQRQRPVGPAPHRPALPSLPQRAPTLPPLPPLQHPDEMTRIMRHIFKMNLKILKKLDK